MYPIQTKNPASDVDEELDTHTDKRRSSIDRPPPIVPVISCTIDSALLYGGEKQKYYLTPSTADFPS
jgi:hypothetical protein